MAPVNPATSTTTSTTTTSVATTEGDAVITITHCEVRGETVELVNSGGEPLTLRGWVLHDENRNHETTLDRIQLWPGDRIVMLSGEDTLDTPETFRWSDGFVWNNDGDEAFLLRPNGTVASSRRCVG